MDQNFNHFQANKKSKITFNGLLVYNHIRERNNLNSPTFFLPPHLKPAAVCRLSVWMSVKLLPVYVTLVTNTITNTARLLVQKRSCMCVCVCVFHLRVHLCLCVSLFVKSCTVSSEVRAPLGDAFSQTVQQMIRTSFVSSLPKLCVTVAQTSTAEADVCVSLQARHPLSHLRTTSCRPMTWLFTCVCPGKDCCPNSQITGLKLFKLKR